VQFLTVSTPLVFKALLGVSTTRRDSVEGVHLSLSARSFSSRAEGFIVFDGLGLKSDVVARIEVVEDVKTKLDDLYSSRFVPRDGEGQIQFLSLTVTGAITAAVATLSSPSHPHMQASPCLHRSAFTIRVREKVCQILNDRNLSSKDIPGAIQSLRALGSGNYPTQRPKFARAYDALYAHMPCVDANQNMRSLPCMFKGTLIVLVPEWHCTELNVC
jgi:hypothetical protein